MDPHSENNQNWKPSWTGRPRVGVIGLGIMGKSMARNIMRAGFDLIVFNRSKTSLKQLQGEGARAADSPEELASHCDVIITVVTDSPDVQQVVLGEKGVVDGARPGSVLIDMSTISPKVTREIAAELKERGIAMLDAPVSGGDIGAREGTLSIMVGGNEDVFQSCLPVFQSVGSNIVLVGENGMGQTVKLVNQIVVGVNLLAVAEGLSFAASAGADVEKTLDVITKGAAGSWALEHLGTKMTVADYAPGFMVKLQQKDLRLALEAAAQLKLPLPGTSLVHQLLTYVEQIGAGDEGTQSLIKTYEALGAASAVKQS